MLNSYEFNVAIETASVVFCAVGIACAFLYAPKGGRYRNLLVAMFALEMVAAGADATASIYRGQAGTVAWMGTHVCNCLTYLASFFLLAVFTTYLCTRLSELDRAPYAKWMRAVWAAAVIFSVLTIAGLFYYIDDDNLYHRSDWSWISYTFAIAVCVVNTILVYLNHLVV